MSDSGKMNEFNNNLLMAGTPAAYTQMEAMLSVEKQGQEKYEKFKERVEAFAEIETIEEAKALAAKIMPVPNEVNRFRIGNARCVVINRSDLFRISIDTQDEFICYDFEP